MGSVEFSWWGVSAIKVCTNVTVFSKGKISCNECCKSKEINIKASYKKIKVCIKPELSYWMAAASFIPVPGVRIALHGAKLLRIMERIYKKLIPLNKMYDKLKTDKIASAICKGGDLMSKIRIPNLD